MDYYLAMDFSKPTKRIIQSIKDKGFNVLRLQTAPEVHLLDENYTIDPRYIKAIKEAVVWAMEEHMYVILCGPFSEFLGNDLFRKKTEEDVHFSGINVSESYKNQSEKLIKAVWTQYTAAFNNSYDEHLIFETLNEPVDNFHEHGWRPKTYCTDCIEDFEILNEYNQLIVNTIRASGGNNTNRFIIVEGLAGSAETITTNLFKLPEDEANDRLIPAYHEYSMAGREDSKLYYTNDIKNNFMERFNAVDQYYFEKHIPVYITEYSLPRVTPILERIACSKDFMAEVTENSRSCAICLHAEPLDNDNFGYYDVWNLEWYDTEWIETIIYAAQGQTFPLSDEFLKANEVKVESIVGKNLLSEPFNTNNWENVYAIKPDILIRSVPAHYKFEFQIEITGSNPILQVGFSDIDWNFNDISERSDVTVTGAVKGRNFPVNSETVTITISEELAAEFVAATRIFLKGQDIIIKSVKVVE